MVMVLTTLTGVKSPIVVTEAPKLDQVQLVKEFSRKEVENKMSTEEYVQNYFADAPIMVAIAKCESHYRQFNADGTVHRGVVNHGDVGVMQINEGYHLNEAEKANYNLYTVEGNTAFARKLYEREGTTPWNSSRPCWGKYQTVDLAINVK